MKLVSGTLLMGLSLIALTINEITYALGGFGDGFESLEEAIANEQFYFPLSIYTGGEDFQVLIWFFMILGAALFIWAIIEEVIRVSKRNA